jgi:hypothetical protein
MILQLGRGWHSWEFVVLCNEHGTTESQWVQGRVN